MQKHIQKIFGCLYGPIIFTDESKLVDNIIIPIETLISCIEDKNFQNIDSKYTTAAKKHGQFIYPIIGIDNNYLIKILSTSIIVNPIVGTNLSGQLTELTQSTHEDKFVGILLSNICHFFIYQHMSSYDQLNLDIVSVILQIMSQLNKSDIAHHDTRKLHYLPYVKREYFKDKSKFDGDINNLTSFPLFCITLSYIREYIAELRKIVTNSMRVDKPLTLKKIDLHNLYDNMIKSIHDYGFQPNDEYIVKSMFTAIIGSAFGIQFIKAIKHVPDHLDNILSKYISLL